MTQAQLYQLYLDATELMVYNDMTEVYDFLRYLADKYNLEFDSYLANEAYLTSKQYNLPKE